MPVLDEEGQSITYVATSEEKETIEKVLKDYIKGRNVINKSYNQFNGRNLFDYIDDSTKRWNGYIPESSPLLDITQSRIFLNFTRNTVISYLSKVAQNMVEPKFVAVNKRSGIQDKKFAEILKDLNQFSLNEENGDARFMDSALEASIKGTVIKYEGYMRQEQDMEVPVSFDATTGKIKTKKETKVIFDNCYQEQVPIEDFYIANAYQPDIQKQPWVIWKRITTRSEAEAEYGNYKNWENVPLTSYVTSSEPTTFYRNSLQTELGKEQVEVIKYYNRTKNWHVIIVNGCLLYDGVIPFKDGKYPFAKGIFEPFGAGDFFWGSSLVNKIMGDQDLLNTLWNMMVDKTTGSLLPYGLSSDLDDMVEDEYLAPNKIRKVTDINKWKFDTLPAVNQGEMSMLEFAQNFANQNSGNFTFANLPGQQKKRLTAREALLMQQQNMQVLSFSMSFLEDFERDRTELRIKHILQFYSIPKIETITGKNGKDIEKLMFREVKLTNTKIYDGRQGERILKIMGPMKDEARNRKMKVDEMRQKIAEDASVQEAMGEIKGVPTEVLHLSIDTFTDYNFEVQIVKNSSYQKSSVLDASMRMDFANWRLSLAQLAPLDIAKLIKWVEEPQEIDPDEFELPAGQQQNPQQMAMAQQAGQQAPGSPLQQAGKLGNLSSTL